MSFNFRYTIEVNSKKYNIRELTFLDYKNLAKSLIETDTNVTSDTFDSLIKYVCDNVPSNTTNLEKFLLLLKIRTVTIGNSVEFFLNDTKIVYNLDNIFNQLNYAVLPYVYMFNNDEYVFNLPTTFTIKESLIDFTIDCLQSINGISISEEHKKELTNNLPALPLTEICTNIINHYKDVSMTIPHIDMTLTPFNGLFLQLLRSIFSYELSGLYNLEYALRKNLNMSAKDFTTLSLQECEILLKTYKEEITQLEKNAQQKTSPSIDS